MAAYKATAKDLHCDTCHYAWNPVMGLKCEICSTHYIDIDEHSVPTGICSNGHVACSRCLGTQWCRKTTTCPVGDCKAFLKNNETLIPQLSLMEALEDARATMDSCVDQMKHSSDGGLYCNHHGPDISCSYFGKRCVTLKNVKDAVEHGKKAEKRMASELRRIDAELVDLRKKHKSALRKQRKILKTQATLKQLKERLDRGPLVQMGATYWNDIMKINKDIGR